VVPYRAYMRKRGKNVFGDPAPTKTCPNCKSADLAVDAGVCPHCTRQLIPAG
jgi:large conductance mechanosensitive channel